MHPKTLSLKIKYFDFQTITRSITLESEVTFFEDLWRWVKILVDRTEVGNRRIRLAGVSLSNFRRDEEESQKQLYFNFEER